MVQGLAFEILAVLGLTLFFVARWRRSMSGKRLLFGAGAGLCVVVASASAGLHMCDSGTPPAWIAIAFGLAIAGVISVSAGRGTHAAALGALLFVESIAVPMRLANAYHHHAMTGNRLYAGGSYWHTALTGARPRRSDGRWVPETTEDCRQRCRASGLCTKQGDRCVATANEDCANSLGCESEGECTLEGQTCVAASDEDCHLRPVCTGGGRCTAWEGKCVASSDGDCGASTACREHGSCIARNGSCEASEDGCARSEACRDFGACRRLAPTHGLNWAMCGAMSDADCRQARVRCHRWGYCTARDGQCMP